LGFVLKKIGIVYYKPQERRYATVRKFVRVSFFFLVTIVLCVGITINITLAQEDRFPSKPISLIIGAAPGSSTEVPARALAKAAEKSLGQPIVCSNTPGAGGARALGQVLKAKPDGYTLVCVPSSGQITSIVEKLDYALPDDFTPIIQFQSVPIPFAVRKDAPWKTWQEFVKYAREHKGIVTVGVFGSKGLNWLLLRQIEEEDRIKFVLAPYSGGGEAAAAILGGHVTASTIVSSIVYAKSGELKLLLVFSDQRLKSFPDVPTAKELYGPRGGALGGGFVGIFGPKGLPKSILTRLHDAFKKGMEDEEYIKVTESFDLVISYRNSEEFANSLKRTDEVTREFLRREEGR
jgi:tripartite-type tricarboxylate transporter receptor subunit TctC